MLFSWPVAGQTGQVKHIEALYSCASTDQKESQGPAQSQRGSKVSTHLGAQESHTPKGLHGYYRETIIKSVQ